MIDYIKDLLFPRNLTCVLCGAELYEGYNLCQRCLGSIQFNTGHTCRYCGRMMRSESSVCHVCKCLDRHFEGGVSAVVYDDYVKPLIFNYKYYHKKYIADAMADLMVDVLMEKFKRMRFDYIVPVPMHRHKMKQRRYNHAAVLAKSLSEKIGIPYKNCLIRTVDTQPLNELDLYERADVLRGIFESEAIEGSVLLVDDIITSGNTANECAKALKTKGAESVYILVFASAE